MRHIFVINFICAAQGTGIAVIETLFSCE